MHIRLVYTCLGGAIAGGVTGGIVGVATVIVICIVVYYWFFIYKKRKGMQYMYIVIIMHGICMYLHTYVRMYKILLACTSILRSGWRVQGKTSVAYE